MKTPSDVQLRDTALSEVEDRAFAWEALVNRYGPIIERAIRQYLATHVHSADSLLIQELANGTWFRIVSKNNRALKDWNPNRSSLPVYLASIARREVQSWYRTLARARKGIVSYQTLSGRSVLGVKHCDPHILATTREVEATIQRWQERLQLEDQVILRLLSEGVDQVSIGRTVERSQGYVSNKIRALRSQLCSILRVSE